MRIACLLAVLLPATAWAQSSAADIAYCNRLADVFERYLGRSANSPVYETPSSSLDSQIAAEQCRQGRPERAIPVLERVLRGNGFTLPPRG